MTAHENVDSSRAARARWLLHPFDDAPAWNRLLQRINPVWSLNEIRARLVRRVEEDDETISLWLQANGRWPGHAAGQHVALGVEIDGVMRQRVFTLSTPERPDGRLRITLRRQPGGGVTDWLHRNARTGQIVTLSRPSGNFVLPQPWPKRLLMLAGGSGLTPMMAMLGQLADENYDGDIVLVQLCRDARKRLFAGELDQLQAKLPGLQIHVHASSQSGRLCASALAALVPELAGRHCLLCGPSAWMAEVGRLYKRRGLSDRLQRERFGAPRPESAAGDDQHITASRSRQMFTQKPGASLLESAEAAGLTPAYGCRAGLCRTCLCKKQRGTVRNLITGLRSEQPDEWVQLCVSVAESDLELSL